MSSLLFLPTELTKNIVAGCVYNYIQDGDKKLIERHVVAPLFIDGTDSEQQSRPESTTTFEMKTSKRKGT